MIYLEDFREIVSRLDTDNQKQETYMDSLRRVDSSLLDVLLENKYVNSFVMQREFLLETLLGRDLKDWVDWYLYECLMVTEPGTPNAWVEEVGYSITDFESFMDFAQHGLKLPMKPRNIS